MENVVIATIKSWNIKEALLLRRRYSEKYNVFIITKKEELTYDRIAELKPKYIFFPHWSWIIPKEIHENFECVVFHMTDLPFGRGGSPLQNLISLGIENTKISALKVVEELDAGPVYLKKDLNLNGSAEEIFIRASKIIFREMIPEILESTLIPKEQRGRVVNFKRRRREDGDISQLNTLEKVFDCIRMLDAEGYPKAFLETEHFVLEFSRASLKTDHIIADVRIYLKEGEQSGE